jgi:hypothetical protein
LLGFELRVACVGTVGIGVSTLCAAVNCVVATQVCRSARMSRLAAAGGARGALALEGAALAVAGARAVGARGEDWTGFLLLLYQSSLRRAAQLASSFRLESWSFRSTEDACVSTVLIEIERRRAISLYA